LAVVSDSGPLIALQRIQQLDLLRALFDHVLIPPAVASEIAPGEQFPDWLRVQTPKQQSRVARLQLSLGVGEREALELSLELRASFLLVDDKAARRAATHLGLPIFGTLGLLVAAKDRGLVNAVRPHLDALQGASFYLTPGLYERVLRDAGE
jgi:predicted nucleic acid-binding protein